MSDQSSLPPLEEYPGYFDGKPPLLRRKGLHVTAAGVAGLLLGLAFAGGGSAASVSPSATEIQASIDTAVRTKLAAAVDDAVEQEKSQSEQELSDTEADLAAAQHQTEAAREDARAAARKAKAAQRRAVASAVARTKRQMRAQFAATRAASAPAAVPAPAKAAPATDPQFSYCYEANDAGYGPYTQGVDPEYGWYDDRDGDGVVCEP